MRLLPDTHVLLWALDGNARLGRPARIRIEDPANEIFFGAAGIWEIAIKTAPHRDRFGVSAMEIVETALRTGFDVLPVTAAAAATVADLPMHHRDPFDRFLVAQAMVGTLRLLAAHALLPRYGDAVMLLPA